MEANSIKIKDTQGQLSEETFKSFPEKPALSVRFDYSSNEQTVHFTTNNIRFTSLPGSNVPGSFLTFLAYNGTMGYNARVFSTVVQQNVGVFKRDALPTLIYKPNGYITTTQIPDAIKSVLEINILKGTVDIFDYSTIPYRANNRTFDATYVHSYPASIEGLPNITNNKIFLDGWYSYTHIVFTDTLIYGEVVKDSLYAYQGFVFIATKNGTFRINAETGKPSIYYNPDSFENSGVVPAVADPTFAEEQDVYEYEDQTEITDYETIMFQLSSISSESPQSHVTYLHSQVLITQELEDAIIEEVVNMGLIQYKTACHFMDWQKLTMKQLSACVNFDYELYEKAQIVVESSRSMCLGGDSIGNKIRC